MLVLGGTHGREMNNGLYLLDTITMTWTKLESNSKKNMKLDPDTSIVYGTGKVFSKRRERASRMEHCSYRYSDFY